MEPAEDELKSLRRIAAKLAKQRASLDPLYEEMVALIKQATANGASRRSVGRAAGLTHTRIQQIVDGKYLARHLRER